MTATAWQRERLAKRQGGICPECSLPLPDGLAGAEVDHVIPRARGGPDRAWNLRLVHFKCNRDKGVSLTAEAAALAAEHGVALREPPVRARGERNAWISPAPPRDHPEAS